MSYPIPGSRFTDVQTSTEGPLGGVLGQVVWDRGNAYKYIKAGAALAANRMAAYDLTADDGYTCIYPAATGNKNVAGKTMAAIASGGYGWIQLHGYALVDFDGASTDATAGNPVVAYDTIGKVIGADVTVATSVAGAFGVAYDASTTDSTIEVFLRGLL